MVGVQSYWLVTNKKGIVFGKKSKIQNQNKNNIKNWKHVKNQISDSIISERKTHVLPPETKWKKRKSEKWNSKMEKN